MIITYAGLDNPQSGNQIYQKI